MSLKHRDSARGFSLIEILVVVAIMLTVAAVVAPNIMTTVQNVRLRSSASSVAGILQATRMRAVRDNARYRVSQTTIGTDAYAFLDLDNDGVLDNNERGELALLPQGVTLDLAGAAAPARNSMNLNFVPQVGLPTYSARGLPCQPGVGAACANNGFVFYFTQARGANTSWAAITVTPAGRVRTWTWDGRRWN